MILFLFFGLTLICSFFVVAYIDTKRKPTIIKGIRPVDKSHRNASNKLTVDKLNDNDGWCIII
jgi:hypothetical protein